MPWRDVSLEEGRDLADAWRAMAVAFVKVERPEEGRGEDLVLAPAMGGLAECVIYVLLSVFV